MHACSEQGADPIGQPTFPWVGEQLSNDQRYAELQEHRPDRHENVRHPHAPGNHAKTRRAVAGVSLMLERRDEPHAPSTDRRDANWVRRQ
jgi:hypothetical protein